MKQVLSVGQCAADHGAISQLLESRFDVAVVDIATAQEALAAIRVDSPDLVLVNRLLDVDHSEGTEVIRAMKADDAISDVPVMLITNFPEHHLAAVKLGAVSGFGKASLRDEQTVRKLAEFLG